MGEELKIFLAICIWTVSALYYCYSAVSKIPKGAPRLLAILPVSVFLAILPLKLSSVNLVLLVAGLLTWLCNFKLILFAFGKGKLEEYSLNLCHFILFACFPIKPRPPDGSQNASRDALMIPRDVLLAVKAVLLALNFKAYSYMSWMHPSIVLALYCVQAYLQTELIMAILAIPARALLGAELDPQFNEPYLATSLQDFWGRRWNLIVTGILRPTVFNPVRSVFAPVTGHNLALLLAVMATFTVSGLMHELLYYYMMRVHPTWEVTWFFVLHGACVVAEVVVKKSPLGRQWRLHRAVSGPLTLVFVVVTAGWLFFAQVTRNGVDVKVRKEFQEFLSFGNDHFNCFVELFRKNKSM